ncbi:MAG: nickel pincer cofactor biosynthesis protein LarB [Gammaproteobacteria bacterium]|nr:nickel pincer cofactor biosynthesis protein LarB [Gammaproteobacteria bacterium]
MSVDDLNIDFARADRLGLAEAIYCGPKSVDQIQRIVDGHLEREQAVLLTRLSQAQFDDLGASHGRHLDYDPVSRTAIVGTPPPLAGRERICVVAAGTSDLPAAREAVRTLAFNGEPCREIYDVGVAGLWRLLERVDDIRGYPVLIAVAGMDAALVSVLGGLMPGVVVAVPTSTGYGVAHGGESALHSALVSCAPGVAVVNIDNGYGAACVALRALHAAARLVEMTKG